MKTGKKQKQKGKTPTTNYSKQSDTKPETETNTPNGLCFNAHTQIIDSCFTFSTEVNTIAFTLRVPAADFFIQNGDNWSSTK